MMPNVRSLWAGVHGRVWRAASLHSLSGKEEGCIYRLSRLYETFLCLAQQQNSDARPKADNIITCGGEWNVTECYPSLDPARTFFE